MRAAKFISPKRLLSLRGDRRLIQAFGDEFGLVYFGSVSIKEEDHRLVRGLTVSTKHKDSHYCIGTYQEYDITFVERSDVLHDPMRKTSRDHKWHIMEFDLKTKSSLPHVFVGLHSQSESFYLQLFTKYPDFRQLHLGNIDTHMPEFLAKYRVYGQPAKIIDIETLLTPLVTTMVTKHFGSLAFEIHESSLYVYSEHARLSYSLLEAMIKNGVWLAHHIDTVSNTGE